jgi:A/G-specific adenine glycosylase
MTPWLVLMAEMCLHRTRADQVAPVFRQLRKLAPTPRAMIRNEDDALKAMRSLGLRWRAENVIEVAKALVTDFGGRVPDSELELRSLPGVGDYVAQAVLCFGFEKRAVLVDTNTARVTGRALDRTDNRRWQLRLDLYRLAGADGPDAAFNYALLDLGALICRAGLPRCESCPVKGHCATGAGAESPPQLLLEEVTAA